MNSRKKKISITHRKKKLVKNKGIKEEGKAICPAKSRGIEMIICLHDTKFKVYKICYDISQPCTAFIDCFDEDQDLRVPLIEDKKRKGNLFNF